MQIFKKIDRKKKTELFSFKSSDHCFCCRLYRTNVQHNASLPRCNLLSISTLDARRTVTYA